MSARYKITSGTPWEKVYGYSRALRVGNHISVSGTAPIGKDGKIAGLGDAAAQARRIFEIVAGALADAGASLDDVVRTRIFVTDIALWESVGRVHGEVFGAIRPACTMVEVAKLIAPELLVEIEADAVIAKEPE